MWVGSRAGREEGVRSQGVEEGKGGARRGVMQTGWIKLSSALVPFKCQILSSLDEKVLLSQVLSISFVMVYLTVLKDQGTGLDLHKA